MIVENAEEGGTSSQSVPREYVARKITHGAVVVAALHPLIGLVFWRFSDESEVNLPDHYGLTTSIALAHRFKSGCVPYEHFKSEIRERNTEWREVNDPEEYGPVDAEVGCGDFAYIAGETGTDADLLVSWFHTAVWVECPAPPVVNYIADFNGFIGYQPVWTDNLADAMRFSQHEVEAGDDLDVSLARALGAVFVVDEAESDFRVMETQAPSLVNHALEADVAWTHARLRLGRYDAVQRWSRAAFSHAMEAGMEWAIADEKTPISGHVQAFPALLDAFKVGVAIRQQWTGAKQRADSCDRVFRTPTS